MANEIYVWNRNWTEQVSVAIKNADKSCNNFVVLAAEITLRGESPKVALAKIDWGVLKNVSAPVGLAVRIGSFSGPFNGDDKVTQYILRICRNILQNAGNAGVKVAELQLDFDCAERNLDGYQKWIEAIRREIKPTPVTFTALPCWLDRKKEFAALVAAADGFILQVHALEKPKSPQDVCIFNPTNAREAVERAAKFGIPFRVSMPTYSYLVYFDKAGKFVGLSAETKKQIDNATATLVNVKPKEVAETISDWIKNRPAMMTGIIWFRLPVESDLLNWRMQTLQSVMQGIVPEQKLTARCINRGKGLFDIELENIGDADTTTEVTLMAEWMSGQKIACDGLNGFYNTISNSGVNEIGFCKSTPDAIRAGERLIVGWLRLERDSEVDVYVKENN